MHIVVVAVVLCVYKDIHINGMRNMSKKLYNEFLCLFHSWTWKYEKKKFHFNSKLLL